MLPELSFYFLNFIFYSSSKNGFSTLIVLKPLYSVAIGTFLSVILCLVLLELR